MVYTSIKLSNQNKITLYASEMCEQSKPLAYELGSRLLIECVSEMKLLKEC
jgi:hypothetical protein